MDGMGQSGVLEEDCRDGPRAENKKENFDDGRYWAGSVGYSDLHIMDEGLATKVQLQMDATIWRARSWHAVTTTMDCGFKELANKTNADQIGTLHDPRSDERAGEQLQWRIQSSVRG